MEIATTILPTAMTTTTTEMDIILQAMKMAEIRPMAILSHEVFSGPNLDYLG